MGRIGIATAFGAASENADIVLLEYPIVVAEQLLRYCVSRFPYDSCRVNTRSFS
jgi:hypothetical protein